jgi:hypothetical protein
MSKRPSIAQGRLRKAAFADFVRLTPKQNIAAGYSSKARRYALKSPGGLATRVTARTPTISARQYETKRAAALFGMSPESATQARARGVIPYVSGVQQERVAKAIDTRQSRKVEKHIGELIPSSHPKKRYATVLTAEKYERFKRTIRRRLNGEYIPDGEWHEMVDIATRYKDPRLPLLKMSPNVTSFAIGA